VGEVHDVVLRAFDEEVVQALLEAAERDLLDRLHDYS
jgi:hypothetical protein